jgi:hypothetical protein
VRNPTDRPPIPTQVGSPSRSKLGTPLVVIEVLFAESLAFTIDYVT